MDVCVNSTSGNCNVIVVIIFSEEANISSLGESWTLLIRLSESSV